MLKLPIELTEAKLVIFDLDDTLFNEIDYLEVAYWEIDRLASEEFGVSRGKVAEWLLCTFKERGRHRIFQEMFDRFAIPDAFLSECLAALRTVSSVPNLKLKPWVGPTLTQLSGRAAILTNGHVVQQKNKVRLLGVTDFFPGIAIYFAELTRPKPYPDSFEQISEDFSVEARECVFIGDSKVDQLFAKQTGIKFIPVWQFEEELQRILSSRDRPN